MAGHSKWSKVKRAKGVIDVKRGNLFSRFSKGFTVAVRTSGGIPSGNPRLRAVVLAALDALAAYGQGMPNEFSV